MAVYDPPVSPRPRVNSDVQILQAAFRAIARLGPAKLTLADVAGEAGVSPASLVQRFGSKRALLLAAAADAAGGHVYILHSLRAKHRLPRRALLGLAECMTMLGETPEQIAHSLAFLQIDLVDPEFLQHARNGSLGFHAGIRALVRDAVAAGELRPCDDNRLARAIQATLNGSILDWAIHRRGSMARWIRQDLAMVLGPYAVAGTARSWRLRQPSRERSPKAG